jgi:hypothetical protein
MDPEDGQDGHPCSRSVPGWRASSVLIVILMSAGTASQGAAPASSASGRPTGDCPSCVYAGRPLVEALNDLRALGLNLIFSSELVRPEMVVQSEPPSAPPRQVLDRILAPFGLEARDGPGGTVLVLQAAGSQRALRGGAGQAGDEQEGLPVPSSPVLRERIRSGASPGDEPHPMTALTQDDLERLPSVGGDASRMIARLPGVASEDKSARFRIRGGANDEALVVLDGLEIDEPYHLKDYFAFSSIVDARAIGNADVLTGIFPAEYGDRMSGVVDLSTTERDGPERTSLGVSMVNVSVLSGGRLGDGRGNWLISARGWHPDAMIDTIEVAGESLDPSYDDLLGKVQFQLPGGSILSAHILASHDDLNYQTDQNDGKVDAGDDHRHAWIQLKTPWTPRLYSQTLVSTGRMARSRDGSSIDSIDGVTRVDDSRSYSSIGLKQDWIFTPGGRALLKWGFDARRLEAEYQYRSHVSRTDPFTGALTVTDRDLALDPSGNELGAYVAGRFRVFTPLTIEIGVRRDRQTLTGEAETSPRVNLVCALGDRSVLRAGWGIFHQPQGINELQIEDGVVEFHPAQRAEHWEADIDHSFAGGLTLGVSAYVKDMTRLRPRYENLFNPFQLFPESEPDRVLVAAPRAVARGIEIGLGMDRGRAPGGRSLSWRAAYALATAEDRISGSWVPRSWDQRHTFNFNLNYRRGERWEMSLAGVYHTGWPMTDVRAEQVQDPDGSLVIQPILGPRNSLRYPPYHRLDLKVTRRFQVGGGTLGLYLDVTNLYGRRNVCCVRDLEYLPQADGGVRVERTEGFWLRQLPIVGLTWDF